MKNKTKETIYETYVRVLCTECKNKNKDLCEIRKCNNGTVKCIYYER